MLMGVKKLILSVMLRFCVDFCAMLLGTLPISTRNVLVIRNAVSSSLREFPGFRKALTLYNHIIAQPPSASKVLGCPWPYISTVA